MPAVCKTCGSCTLRVSSQLRHTVRHTTKTQHVRPWAQVRRAASSAAATALVLKPTDDDTGHRVLTVLHKTKYVISRVLPSRPHAPLETGSLEFWERTLQRTYDSLCPSPEVGKADKVRIAVYGCDDISGVQELVAALLEDPFASESQRTAIHARRKAASQSEGFLTIEYGPTAENKSSVLRLNSAWLQQFGAPVSVLEFDSRSPSPASSATIGDLITADIPVLVCNPASTSLHTVLSPSSDLSLPLKHPNAVLILTSTSGNDQLSEQIRASLGRDVTVLFIDPVRALQGLHALDSSPSYGASVQKYQDDYSGSRISDFTHAVSRTIPRLDSPEKTVKVLHAETARAVVQEALSTCLTELDRAQEEVIKVCDEVSSLRGKMEDVRVRTPTAVFGREQGGNAVLQAVEQSKKDIRAVLDRLTWWRLLWRVDDVGETLMDSVSRSWCRDLEYELVFHAGRLGFIQQSFTDSATALTSSFKASPAFHSPVLQNSLSQISASSIFPIEATAFLQPLHVRRQQLRWPTARLQTTAQRVLLGMGGSVFGSAGVAWAGWVGQLGIFDMAMQAETVIGAGMLGAAVGVRWAVGRFEGAKKKWLKDYDRVGEGLERDLRTSLVRMVNERALIVPEKACDGLERLVSKRKEEIEQLREEVDVLQNELSRRHL